MGREWKKVEWREGEKGRRHVEQAGTGREEVKSLGVGAMLTYSIVFSREGREGGSEMLLHWRRVI